MRISHFNKYLAAPTALDTKKDRSVKVQSVTEQARESLNRNLVVIDAKERKGWETHC